MATDMIGTMAYRPSGSTFGGYEYSPNGIGGFAYGNYSNGYNRYNGSYNGYSGYGYGGGMIGDRMLSGVTRTTAYKSFNNDKAEDRAMKEAAKDVRDIIRIEESGTFSGDFSSRKVQKKWAAFRDVVKQSGRYRNMVENATKEFMDSGLPENEARKEAEKNVSKQLFGLMCELYEEYVGVDAKEDIMKHNDYWTNEAERVDKLWEHLKKISSK